MSTFIKTYLDFGNPWVTLRVMLLKPSGRDFHALVGRLKDQPQQLCEEIEKFVKRYRPQLQQVTVFALTYSLASWDILVCSPQLPRLPQGQCREEYLEVCPACLQPMEVGSQQFYGAIGEDQFAEFCSETCSKNYLSPCFQR